MTATLRSRAVAATGSVPSGINQPARHAAHPIVRAGAAKPPTIATLFALAQNHRLDIFRLVVEAGDDGVPAGEITRRLGLRKSLISFHLKHLRLAGLVTLRREGRIFIYTARNYAVNRLMCFLSESCSQARASSFVRISASS
jgi:DNA-binding transcriptional ArsR family regulator